MEEKKFPWLLRLLSINKISIPILDTFVANKERMIGIFCLDSENHLIQFSSSTIGIRTPYSCLKHIKSASNLLNSKHCFFWHKGKRTEVSPKQISSYLDFKSGIPLITYIQSAREDYLKFLVFSVEYWKDGYKSAFIPASSHPTILEKVKDLCKYLIGIIESHEQKRVFKLQIELMVSVTNKIWLSHLDFCQTVTEDYITSNTASTLGYFVGNNNSNELLEIINELDSPRNVLQRKPSIIKKLDKPQKLFDLIKIESPDSDFESELSNIIEEESFTSSPKISQSASKKEEKSKISKNYLELISKTRVKANYPHRKILISDEEYRDEYKKLVNYFSASPKGNNEFIRRKPYEYSLLKSNTIRTPKAKEKSESGSLDFVPVGKQSFNFKREIYSPILSQRKSPSINKKEGDAFQIFTNTQLIFANNYRSGSRILSPFYSRDNEYSII